MFETPAGVLKADLPRGLAEMVISNNNVCLSLEAV